jgi:hypothetical protein
MMSPDLIWEVPQTMDTIDPRSSHYNAKSAYAKTLRRDGKVWGDVPPKSDCPRDLAHDNGNISCQICHIVGDRVFRLPFADEGEPACAAQQI